MSSPARITAEANGLFPPTLRSAAFGSTSEWAEG